jgi:hypothetical protein
MLVSAGWVLEDVRADGTEVRVRHRSGGCYSFHAASADQADKSVTISVLLQRPASSSPCAPPTTTAAVSVLLRAPLGDRELKHGDVSHGFPVAEPPRATTRLAGKSRIETAVALSRYRFPHGAAIVYLAREDMPFDALAAGVLDDGPILLLPTCDGVPTVVGAEINRLAPERLVGLGGRGALCEETLAEAAAF